MFSVLPPHEYDLFWKTQLLLGGKIGLVAGIGTSLLLSSPIERTKLLKNTLVSTVASLGFSYFKIFFPQLALATTLLTLSFFVISRIKNKDWNLYLTTTSLTSMLCFLVVRSMPQGLIR